MTAITKEALLERRRALEDDLVAVSGALRDVDFWLAYIDAGDGDEPSPAESKGDA